MAGGAAGSGARYAATLLFAQKFHATLAVNIIGSLLIGALSALFMKNPEQYENWRLLLCVGVLGGFTTFSAFSLDVLNMVRDGQHLTAALYIILSLTLSLVSVFAAFHISSKFFA